MLGADPLRCLRARAPCNVSWSAPALQTAPPAHAHTFSGPACRSFADLDRACVFAGPAGRKRKEEHGMRIRCVYTRGKRGFQLTQCPPAPAPRPNTRPAAAQSAFRLNEVYPSKGEASVDGLEAKDYVIKDSAPYKRFTRSRAQTQTHATQASLVSSGAERRRCVLNTVYGMGASLTIAPLPLACATAAV